MLDHLHVHLVPRWNGDTNFMTVVGNVRVLPEDLNESAARLRPVFERLAQATCCDESTSFVLVASWLSWLHKDS